MFVASQANVRRNDYADAPRLPPRDEARSLFNLKCAPCHTVGQGALVGPDLQGVTARRDRAWLARWLKDPDQLLAANDPVARELYERHHQVSMPDLDLTDGEVAALLGFLEERGAKPASREAGRAR